MLKMPFSSLLRPFASSSSVWVYYNLTIMLGNNGHVLTPPHGLKRVYDYTISTWLHACQYIALTCMYINV